MTSEHNPNIIKLPFEMFSYRCINGKKDTTKTYTIIEGVVMLPNGQRASTEALLQGTQHFQPGMYDMHAEIVVERQTRRVGLMVRAVLPQRAAAPARAAA